MTIKSIFVNLFWVIIYSLILKIFTPSWFSAIFVAVCLRLIYLVIRLHVKDKPYDGNPSYYEGYSPTFFDDLLAPDNSFFDGGSFGGGGSGGDWGGDSGCSSSGCSSGCGGGCGGGD